MSSRIKSRCYSSTPLELVMVTVIPKKTFSSTAAEKGLPTALVAVTVALLNLALLFKSCRSELFSRAPGIERNGAVDRANEGTYEWYANSS
eukprot:4994471-Amphidinium_carterae.1